MNGDECATTEAGYATLGRVAGQRNESEWASTTINRGRRIRPKGEEARHAIGIVLQALECDVSIASLEHAIATIKAHLEAAA
jgi:hypothetical protein